MNQSVDTASRNSDNKIPHRGNPLIINNNNNETVSNQRTIFVVAFILEGATIILVNVLLMVFLLRFMARLKSKHVAKCFINLQVSHILFGVLLIVGQFVSERVLVLCTFSVVVQMFLSMLLKIVDRYVIIRLPYKYKRVHSRHLLVFICGTWFVSVTSLLGMFFFAADQTDDRTLTLILTVGISVAIVVLVVCNSSVYLIARRHSLAILNRRHGELKPPLVLWKPLFTCVAIVTSFSVLWLPYLVHNAIVLGHTHEAERHSLFSQTVLIISSLNSIADPLIFIWLNRDIKHELRSKFGDS